MNRFLSRRNISILFISFFIFIGIGYMQWKHQFITSYYADDTSLQGQLFKNVANTTVETEENFPLFSSVPYEKVTLRIGSLASKYDDSNQAQKATNIINSTELDKNFREWLIKAFDENEARKITEHIDVYYRGELIKEISY